MNQSSNSNNSSHILDSKKAEILDQVESVYPFDETEEEHQMFILNFVASQKIFCSRTNKSGHLTASAWITDRDHTHVLMIHHKKLNRWLQPGGHIEAGDASLYEAALREAKEETGIENIVSADSEEDGPEIFDVDVHIIPERNDEPTHHHLDIRFHFYANLSQKLATNQEVKGIKWVPLAELSERPPEDSIFRLVEKTLEM